MTVSYFYHETSKNTLRNHRKKTIVISAELTLQSQYFYVNKYKYSLKKKKKRGRNGMVCLYVWQAYLQNSSRQETPVLPVIPPPLLSIRHFRKQFVKPHEECKISAQAELANSHWHVFTSVLALQGNLGHSYLRTCIDQSGIIIYRLILFLEENSVSFTIDFLHGWILF